MKMKDYKIKKKNKKYVLSTDVNSCYCISVQKNFSQYGFRRATLMYKTAEKLALLTTFSIYFSPQAHVTSY